MIRLARPSRRQVMASATAALLLRPRIALSDADDTLVLRADGDFQTLDPAFQAGGIEDEIGRVIFPSLTHYGPADAPVSWTPYAAASVEAADATTIRFTLREGLVWTHGYGAVTAEDVKFSFERVADPEMGSPWHYAFDALAAVEIIDARSGVIHLRRPYAPFLNASLPGLGGRIVCKAAVEHVGGRFTTSPPATCGPYVLEDWVPKQSIVLAANPDWPGPAPGFRRVRFQIIEDADTALLAFEARAIMFTRISLNALASYRKHLPPATTLIQMPGIRFSWLTINIANPKLADPRIRRAIQRAIDVDQILAGAYSDLCKAATGVVMPDMPGARDHIRYPFDKAAARALLVEAGATDLAFELAVLAGETELLVAQIIQALLADIGIDVVIRSYDDGIYWTLGDKNSGDGWKALELVLMSSTSGVDPAENLTWFRPEQIGAWNWSGFDSPEYESLYQQGLETTDPAQRGPIYRRMQDLMEDSGGFVFIADDTYAAVCRPGIRPFIEPDDLTDVSRFARVIAEETTKP